MSIEYVIGHEPAVNIASNAVWVATDQVGGGKWYSLAQFKALLAGVTPPAPEPVPTPTPTPTPTPSPSPSPTTFSPPSAAAVTALGFTPSTTAFQDLFPGTTLNTAKWNPYMATAAYGRWGNQGKLPAPLSALANSNSNPMYNAEYCSPAQLTVSNGVLSITAVPDTSEPGYSVRSGCICTEGLYKFGPGSLVRVLMQEPPETGAWPAIWHLDGNYEVDDQEGGHAGTSPLDSVASNFHAGGDSQTTTNTGTDLAVGFHLYELAYSNSGVATMFCDGEQTGHYSGVSGDFEIIINLAVATPAAAGFQSQPPAGWTSMVMRVGGVEVLTK